MASLSEVEAILVTALVAAMLAAWGVVTQRVVSRRTATIDYMTHDDTDRDLIAARKIFNEVSEAKGKLSTYCQPNDLTVDEQDAVRLVLNDYERLSIAIQNGVFDLGIIRQYERGTIIRDWSRCASFVYKLRMELDNQGVYYEFETLADWMQDHRRPKRRIWTRLWF